VGGYAGDIPDLPGPTVQIAPAHRGRVTGYSVACTDHGAMPVLAPSKPAARLAATRHIDAEHLGQGRLVER
jgi:hypothetical protein